MRGLNKVEIIGYVGNDPDVQATNDGTIRSRFNVAVNHLWYSSCPLMGRRSR